jgi:hypothetical protein
MDGYGYKKVRKGRKKGRRKYASGRFVKGEKKSGSIYLKPRSGG